MKNQKQNIFCLFVCLFNVQVKLAQSESWMQTTDLYLYSFPSLSVIAMTFSFSQQQSPKNIYEGIKWDFGISSIAFFIPDNPLAVLNLKQILFPAC